MIGSMLILPLQLEALRGALELDRNRFAKVIGTQFAIPSRKHFLAAIAGYIRFDSVLKLALGSMAFCLITGRSNTSSCSKSGTGLYFQPSDN